MTPTMPEPERLRRESIKAVETAMRRHNMHYLKGATKEDLASDCLVRFYETGQTALKAIYPTAEFILLEYCRSIPQESYLFLDELDVSPVHSPVYPGSYQSAIAFVLARLTSTERRIAEAYLVTRGDDRSLIADLAGTTPDNVSKYLGKMKVKVDIGLQELTRQSAQSLLSDEPQYGCLDSLLSLSRSRVWVIERQLTTLSWMLWLTWDQSMQEEQDIKKEVSLSPRQVATATQLAEAAKADLRSRDDPRLHQTLHECLAEVHLYDSYAENGSVPEACFEHISAARRFVDLGSTDDDRLVSMLEHLHDMNR